MPNVQVSARLRGEASHDLAHLGAIEGRAATLVLAGRSSAFATPAAILGGPGAALEHGRVVGYGGQSLVDLEPTSDLRETRSRRGAVVLERGKGHCISHGGLRTREERRPTQLSIHKGKKGLLRWKERRHQIHPLVHLALVQRARREALHCQSNVLHEPRHSAVSVHRVPGLGHKTRNALPWAGLKRHVRQESWMLGQSNGSGTRRCLWMEVHHTRQG
mmetsp:Transcript_9502/g.26919  ORF Transcript_9502/g.26919 Transcript_9502/m.26919 type:complete len:218 (-) Transcript_9502:4-657(-)